MKFLRTPNLNALRTFDAAARHLNFRLAAEELNVTQGAVAQQVRRLEADLGLPLFHRRARGLALTEIGRGYHRPIRQALAMIDDATRKLRPATMRITLSVTPSFASKWLVPRLAGLSEVHPDIDLQTVASEGLADFQTDGVHVAIRQGNPPFGKGLRGVLLSSADLCAVCGPEYIENAPPIGGFADFASHPLIQDSHRHWDSLLETAGIRAQRRIIQFNQTALAMDAAANGQGIALAPLLLLGTDIKSGRLVELWRDTRLEQGGFYVVYPDAQVANPAITSVVDWILSQVKGR